MGIEDADAVSSRPRLIALDGQPVVPRAVESGGDYLLSGRKLWITNAAEASLFIVLANIDPGRRELVWNTTMVSMEGFGVTPDGRHLTGMFPWPAAGVADLATKCGACPR